VGQPESLSRSELKLRGIGATNRVAHSSTVNSGGNAMAVSNSVRKTCRGWDSEIFMVSNDSGCHWISKLLRNLAKYVLENTKGGIENIGSYHTVK